MAKRQIQMPRAGFYLWNTTSTDEVVLFVSGTTKRNQCCRVIWGQIWPWSPLRWYSVPKQEVLDERYETYADLLSVLPEGKLKDAVARQDPSLALRADRLREFLRTHCAACDQKKPLRWRCRIQRRQYRV